MIADYTKAIRLDPKNAEAYSDRGVAYKEIGQSDKEIADFSEAIRLDPKYAKAYYGRGLAYQRKGGTRQGRGGLCRGQEARASPE